MLYVPYEEQVCNFFSERYNNDVVSSEGVHQILNEAVLLRADLSLLVMEHNGQHSA